LRERDILIELNGVALDSVATLQRVLSEHANGVPTDAFALRGAEKHLITIVPVSRPVH
jgi:S1-C subfamily serine protease